MTRYRSNKGKREESKIHLKIHGKSFYCSNVSYGLYSPHSDHDDVPIYCSFDPSHFVRKADRYSRDVLLECLDETRRMAHQQLEGLVFPRGSKLKVVSVPLDGGRRVAVKNALDFCEKMITVLESSPSKGYRGERLVAPEVLFANLN